MAVFVGDARPKRFHVGDRCDARIHYSWIRCVESLCWCEGICVGVGHCLAFAALEADKTPRVVLLERCLSPTLIWNHYDQYRRECLVRGNVACRGSGESLGCGDFGLGNRSLEASRWNDHDCHLEISGGDEAVGRSPDDSKTLQPDAVWRFTRGLETELGVSHRNIRISACQPIISAGYGKMLYGGKGG